MSIEELAAASPTAEEAAAIVRNNRNPIAGLLEWCDEIDRAREELETL